MFKQSTLAFALIACAVLPHTNAAAITGHPTESNATAQHQERDWATYLASSDQLRAQDQALLAAELKALGLQAPSRPAPTKEFGFDTEQPLEWFKTAEGKRIMDIILSFQTPSGGWSKRTDMAAQPRARGQAFGVEDDYIPTFDNGATSTQITLLARAFKATGDKRYRAAVERGLQLILSAQYPNGGWPQSFPLAGGYHDHITYNDALMHDLMVVLHSVAKSKNDFDFVTPAQRKAAQASLERALECVLKTQVISNGALTIWGAQHHARTLEPAQARAYEMAALTSSESVWMLDFLMTLDRPSPAIINAVHSAAAWYQANQITGKTWIRGDAQLIDNKDAPPMWARFYELDTNKPIFGDRDGSAHYEIGKVSQERREGYAWYTTSPNAVLKRYATWAKKFPRK